MVFNMSERNNKKANMRIKSAEALWELYKRLSKRGKSQAMKK